LSIDSLSQLDYSDIRNDSQHERDKYRDQLRALSTRDTIFQLSRALRTHFTRKSDCRC
jgi:hypothetical protein